MARPKKDHTVQVSVGTPVIEAKAKVKVLSQRPGDIIAKGGVVIKFNDIVELDFDVAVNLEKMHPGQIRIL